MLGGSSSSALGSSGPDYATTVSAAHEVFMSNNNNNDNSNNNNNNNSAYLFEDEQDKIDRNSAGNRWPRQETLALLKIRSDMDAVFRDSSLKGPLWDDVSRQMAELGFNRSSKKCKEKFENVYKYHKRTKDGRATKQDGKSYRFFDQLEALDQYHNSPSSSLPPLPPSQPSLRAMPVVSTTMAMPVALTSSNIHVPSTVPLPTTPTPSFAKNTVSFTSVAAPTNPVTRAISTASPSQIPKVQQANLVSNSPSSSSSTSSDEEFVEGRANKRKRKWKDFFERLMNEVIEKQEKLQKKFLDAIEKREHDRIVREESWKMQEMERMNREHEILVKERSMTAAKDAAVISFLQKVSEQQNPTQSQPQPPSQQQPQSQPQPQPQKQQQRLAPPPPPLPQVKQIKEIQKSENGGKTRWPKTEVQALINLRTSLDLKYLDNGPKGPLWEDISAGMAKIGYNRSAKRCKEKWENINKYFKKVKESNKRRTEDSKTCPYFHLLDALYKEKNKFDTPLSLLPNYDHQTQMAPLMVQPEQQWPLQQDLQRKRAQSKEGSVVIEEDVGENENIGRNEEDDDEDDYDDDDDDENDEGDDGGTGNYEIVSNKPGNYNTVGNVV